MKQGSATEPPKISEMEKVCRLRLMRTPGLGPVTFFDLIAAFGSAADALHTLPELTRSGSQKALVFASIATAEKELAAAHRAGMTLHAHDEDVYPPLLAQLDMPPPLLYSKGNTGVWQHPTVAIVGSRHPSAAALKLTEQFAASLAADGFRIVSGLARGIDAAAHRASLRYGTVAVLAGGLDAIYPPEHERLSEEIAETGLLISECPPGFNARSQDFPRRNRIISGCSLGVIVIEAKEKSGSLITARLAAEQNREVFAIPNSPLETRAAGTNSLIKQGATFTLSPGDVTETLGPLLQGWAGLSHKRSASPSHTERPPAHLDPGALSGCAREVLQLLTVSPVAIDDLARLTGIDARTVNAALAVLDASGQLDRPALGLVALKP